MKLNAQFKEDLIHDRYLTYVTKMKLETEMKDIKKQIKKTDNVILKVRVTRVPLAGSDTDSTAPG
jgi:hypothetical protein